MKQPVDHVLRPQLPWRGGPGVTECGLDASKISTLTREDFQSRLKEMGQQRTAILTCMTCMDTARRWGRWEDDPRTALEREIQWEGSGRWSRSDRGDALLHELHAIAALVETHRDEFDEMLRSGQQRREWLAKKAEHARAKKTQRPSDKGGL